MIEIHLIENSSSFVNEAGLLLHHLNNKLDKEKFCGKILLSYDLGMLQGVKIEENFNLDSLKARLK